MARPRTDPSARLHQAAPAGDAAALRALPQFTRGTLWVSAGVSTCAALALSLGVPGEPAAGTAAAAFGVIALVSMVATRLPAAWLAAAVTLVFAAATLAIGAATELAGWGVQTPALSFIGILVCLLGTTAGWRAGTGLAVLAAAMVLLLAELAPAAPGLAAALGMHLVAIAAGLAGGALASQSLIQLARGAHVREQRLRRLLALAADAHWETDDQCRVFGDAGAGGAPNVLAPADGVSRPLWELPQFASDAETLDTLQADMEARRPFRDVPVRWVTAQGRRYAFLASGEPRFDDSGCFTGYWGVVRDVTPLHTARAAQAALVATETRYQELFSRIPTPLVLHHDGIVIDANPAAVTMFGHDTLLDMVGSDVLASYEDGESRERARLRMLQLQPLPPGAALPVASFRLLVQGRAVSVRATSVRVDAEGGVPALLAIYVDDTERLAVDETIRRSEAVLSHLVATSPDLITLTELASGRYAMVNHSFERLIGWSAAEAVGRTALDLCVWASEADRQAFVALVENGDGVTNLPTQFLTRDGRPISMLVSAARFEMERRDYLVINARDVTDSEHLRLQREAILANASIGIAVTRQGRFLLANRHFEQLYGWGAGELAEQPAGVVWVNDDDRAEVARLAGPVLAAGEPLELERTARRKDGSTFVAHLRGHAVDPANPAEGGTVWIVEDVTERRQFELALARARDDAEAANRAKSAFLANTSHELRTPLNGIIGLARLARDPLTSDAHRRQHLDEIVESAQALAGIISDILDLSKIEAGKLLVETTTFDLGALLHTLQRTYATLAAAHGLGLTLDAGDEVAGPAVGDPLRVRQILSNYLSNAIKFTGSGSVALHARRVAGGPLVRLEVRDTGPGIVADVRAQLFQPFTQGDQSTTRRYGGTGLGLSICRELATLMGGSVGVDSEPGAGSIFWAELPLPPAAAVAMATPAVAAPAPRSLQGRHVLMVEDNAVNMMIAVAMLERWGVTVAQAPDGREALPAVQRAAAAGRPFDAVLMDVQMPVMSGYEATRALREAGHRLPVIALTAAALVTEREAALRAGMDDFLTKPIDADKLQAALVRWCHAAAPAPLTTAAAA